MSSHHHHYCYPPPHHHHCSPPPPDPHLHFHHPPDPYPYPHYPPPHQTHLPQKCCSNPNQQQEQETITNTTISSLIRRISALETAISTSSNSNSLRNAAARIIQTHFRAFLLRRSRTLRQLKDLAFIKSELGFLKMSVSGKTWFDYDVVCRKVRVLLRKLAHIQGGDPMIRDGKSVVSRDLNRFLDYIDGFYVERTRVSRYVSSNSNSSKTRVSNGERDLGNRRGVGGLKRVDEEKLRGLAERIDKLAVKIDEDKDEDEEGMGDDRVVTRRSGGVGNRSGGLVMQKPVKRVSFAEDGNVYRLVRKNLNEDICDDSVDEEDLDGEREIEEIGLTATESVNEEEDEAESEEGGSSRSSEGEKDLTSYPQGKR